MFPFRNHLKTEDKIQISLTENIPELKVPELKVKIRRVHLCRWGLHTWAGPVYLRQADVPGQQQDEQRALAQFTEEQHQAADCTTGRCRRHQTETREARHIDDHVTLGHMIRCDEVHAVPSDVHNRQEVLTIICKTQELGFNQTLFI